MTLVPLLLLGFTCTCVVSASAPPIWAAIKRRSLSAPVNIFHNHVFPDPADLDWIYEKDEHGALSIHTMKINNVRVRVNYHRGHFTLALLDDKNVILVATGHSVLRYYQAIDKFVSERSRVAAAEKLELDLTRLLGP